MKFPKITLRQLSYFSFLVQIVVFSVWLLSKIFFSISIFDYLGWALPCYFLYFFIALIVFSEDKNKQKFTIKNYLLLGACLPIALPFLILFATITAVMLPFNTPLTRQPVEERYDLYKIENGKLVIIDRIRLENGDFPIDGNLFGTDSLAVITATDTIKFKANEKPAIN